MLSNAVKILVVAGFAGFGAAIATPAAHAGEWRLDASQCPDLREDRRDRRITWSRADLREDLRDARITRCPAKAYYYVPGPRERSVRRTYDRDLVVRHTSNGRYVVVDRRGRPTSVRIVVRR